MSTSKRQQKQVHQIKVEAAVTSLIIEKSFQRELNAEHISSQATKIFTNFLINIASNKLKLFMNPQNVLGSREIVSSPSHALSSIRD
jgi:hypothetical protein